MLTKTSARDVEARRLQRISLALPIRVEGKIDRSTGWDEITRLKDVSAFGVGFHLNRPVKRGRVVMITLPMPRQLRCFDYMEPQYRVWGLVRRCVVFKSPAEVTKYAIGVAFIGKHPPPGFTDNPSKLFDITQLSDQGFWEITDAPLSPDERDLPKELRRHSRHPIPMNILLEALDADGNVISAEMTVTENISLGGASVFTTLAVEPGTFIRVTSEQYRTTIISVVRGKRMGPDGIPRLHIEFVDRFFPLEGID
jgi:hypothetical protein